MLERWSMSFSVTVKLPVGVIPARLPVETGVSMYNWSPPKTYARCFESEITTRALSGPTAGSTARLTSGGGCRWIRSRALRFGFFPKS